MINETDEQTIEFLKNLPNFRPLYQYLNLKIEVNRGSCQVYLPHDEKLTIGHNIIHGGVIATIMDVAGAVAAMSLTKKRTPTISLHIHYLEPATSSLTAIANVSRVGIKVVFTEIKTYDSKGKLVASGLGVYGVSEKKLV